MDEMLLDVPNRPDSRTLPTRGRGGAMIEPRLHRGSRGRSGVPRGAPRHLRQPGKPGRLRYA